MFGKLQALGRVPVAACAVLLALLVGCEISGRASTSSQCDYVILVIQDAPTPVFLGLCKESVRALPDVQRLVADAPPAESLLKRVKDVDLEGDIGPLSVFVAAGKASSGRTKDGPSFCLLEQEDMRLLVLRATGCAGEAENRKILEAASRVTHELSWTLFDPTSETRFRDAMLRELEASGVEAEDVRLLSYSLGEPVP
jgi:hypothetical protein